MPGLRLQLRDVPLDPRVRVADYKPWQHRRTAIRPGMTGWWQVNGRADRPVHEHTDFDLYYVENYSLLLDLRILGRTVGAVITGRGAY